MNRGRKNWKTETLIRRALSARTEKARWGSVRELHTRGTKRILEQARILCQSDEAKRQMLGADILAQLGVPERSFRKEASAILRSMLKETNAPEVLSSVLYALGHSQPYDDYSGLSEIAKLRNHSDAEVRHAVVFALLGREHNIAIETLIYLSDDEDEETRDWAVFGLGAQIEIDTPAIREALWRHIDDLHHNTRWEAINGLAIRRDPRIRPILINEISSKNPEAGWFQIAAESEDLAYLSALEKKLPPKDDRHDCNEDWLKELEWAISKIRESNNIP